jgi:tetratricopeptide (TPR) repeat protein
MARVLTGATEGVEAEAAEAVRKADRLKQPVHMWRTRADAALVEALFGRFEASDALSAEAFALGERASPDAAVPMRAVQQYAVRELRGDAAPLVPALASVAAAHPTRPMLRAALAHAQASTGATDAAATALEELAKERFARVPFDQEWLLAASYLAELCSLLGDSARAQVLLELLEPYRELNALDVAEAFRGPVARYLALLAATAGRRDEAARHLETALEVGGRTGSRPWLARTQHDRAELLLSLGERERALRSLGEALAAYRDLGMTPWVERAEALQASLA